MRSIYVLATIGALIHSAVIKTPVSNFYGSISQKTEDYTFNTVQLLNTSTNLDASEIVPNALGFSQKSTYAAIMAFALIVFGSIFLMKGYGAIKLFIGLTGAYVFGIIALVVLNASSTSGVISLPAHADLIRFVIVIMAGLAGYFVFNCLSKIAFFFLGAMMGLVVATVLISIEFVANSLKSDTIRSTFMGVFALVFGLWTFIHERIIVTISACIVGSYSVFVGLDYWVESGFSAFLYHAFYLLDPIVFSAKSYSMVAGFILVAAIGIYYQLKIAGKPSQT